MSSLGLIFFASCLVSFIGSLQLGPVNLFVIDAALLKGKKAARLIALGGVLPEIIYCSVAVFSNKFVQQMEIFQLYFRIIFIVILISIGLYFLFKKPKQIDVGVNFIEELESNKNYPLKGFSLAILNPQLLPFWIIVLSYFNTNDLLRVSSFYEKVGFVLGSAVGAYCMLMLLTQITLKFKKGILNRIRARIFPLILSILFFAIAIQQIISLLLLN